MATRSFVFLLLVVTLILGYTAHGHFLAGNFFHYHDSAMGLMESYLFFDSIFRGELPLWSHALNSGMPLWTSVEAFAVFDPVAVVVWTISFFTHRNGALAYQWTCVAWLWIFALGGMLLTAKINRAPAVLLAVFVVLFGGPIASSLSSQTWGYLNPFRYTPLVLWCFLNLWERPSRNRAIALGLITAFSAASYQTVFSLIYVSLFIVSFLLCQKGSFRFLLNHANTFLLSAVVSAVGLFPTFLIGLEMLREVPVIRTHGTGTYRIPLGDLLPSLMDRKLVAWHGGLYMGLVPLVIVLAGFVLLAAKKSRQSFSPLEKTWLCVTLLSLALAVDHLSPSFLNESSVGVRNFGFFVPLILLGLLQIMGLCWRVLKLGDVLGWTLSLLVLVDIWSFSLGQVYGIPNVWPIAPRVPILGQSVPPKFTPTRQWGWNPLSSAPFNHLRPVYDGTRSATSRATVSPHAAGEESTRLWSAVKDEAQQKWGVVPGLLRGTFARVVAITQLFQLPSYDKLVSSGLPESILRMVLGVDVPILRWLDKVVLVRSEGEALEKLSAVRDSKDLASLAFLESKINRPLAHSVRAFQVRKFTQTSLEILVKTEGPSLLLYADNYSPDWMVKIDGKREELLKLNVTNKGVWIPAGTHTVEFVYKPVQYLIAFWFRVFYWAGAAAWMFLLLFKKGSLRAGGSMPALTPASGIPA
jgi:hypothetical protein